MTDDAWYLDDDGWRHCERCNEGFTTWESWEDYKQDCGYHEDAEQLLCPECWAQEELKKRG